MPGNSICVIWFSVNHTNSIGYPTQIVAVNIYIYSQVYV